MIGILKGRELQSVAGGGMDIETARALFWFGAGLGFAMPVTDLTALLKTDASLIYEALLEMSIAGDFGGAARKIFNKMAQNSLKQAISLIWFETKKPSSMNSYSRCFNVSRLPA